jgi:hypothetical protein
MEEMGEEAFAECGTFREVLIVSHFPSAEASQLPLVGRAAFSDCRSLSFVQIPSSVEEIGEAAVAGGEALYEIATEDSFGGGAPSPLRVIGRAALSRCLLLGSIHLSDSVGVIGEAPFADC